MDYFYGVDVYDRDANGMAVLQKRREGVDAVTVLTKREDDENIWNADITLEIFINKEGIGFKYEVPAGYSEYTYDPDTTSKFYKTHDVEWFMNLGLDADCRHMLYSGDGTLIVLAIQNLEAFK